MCMGPELAIALASMAASGVGNYIQTKRNNDSAQAQINARNAAMLAGNEKQNEYAAQGQNLVNQTANKFTGPAQQQTLGDLVNARSTAINNNSPAVPATGVDPINSISTAPKVVQSDLGAKMGKAAAFANQQGNALGNIGGIGDLLSGNTLALNDNQNQLNTVSNFARGTAGVTTAQENSAYNNARKSPSVFGQLLSTAGNLGSMYAAGTGKLPGQISDLWSTVPGSVTTGPGAVTTGIGGEY